MANGVAFRAGVMERVAYGEVLPIPTFPLVARKSVEVPTSEFVPEKYATCPVVPVKSEEVATESVLPEPISVRVPERPSPSVGVEVAANANTLPAAFE